MTERKNRRRSMVVNKALQSAIVRSIVGPPTLALAATAALVGFFCVRLHEEALVADIALGSVVPLFFSVVGFLLLGTVCSLYAALRVSHRMAGPMYRFRKTLESVQQGELGIRIKLRKGDYLTELADDLNGFLEWLERHPPSGAESPPRAAPPAPEPEPETAGSAASGRS